MTTKQKLGIAWTVAFIGLLAGTLATPETCPPHYHWSTNLFGYSWLVLSGFMMVNSLLEKEK